MANFRKDKAELPLAEHPKPTPNFNDRKVKSETEESGNAKTDMAGGRYPQCRVRRKQCHLADIAFWR